MTAGDGADGAPRHPMLAKYTDRLTQATSIFHFRERKKASDNAKFRAYPCKCQPGLSATTNCQDG
jgi:hypothetical protein